MSPSYTVPRSLDCGVDFQVSLLDLLAIIRGVAHIVVGIDALQRRAIGTTDNMIHCIGSILNSVKVSTVVGHDQ